MAYHPENVEIPLGNINLEHRKTSIGGVEQIAVISPEEVALAVSRMDYDSMGKFIDALSTQLDADGKADSHRDKPRRKLANCLYSASMHLDDARDALKRAWSVCANYMSRTPGGYDGK